VVVTYVGGARLIYVYQGMDKFRIILNIRYDEKIALRHQVIAQKVLNFEHSSLIQCVPLAAEPGTSLIIF